MAEALRLFILAGEPSGDRIGADLVQRLRRKRPVGLSGVGGPELAAEGLKSLYPMENLSVMGWTDVLKRLPLLLWRARQTADAIIQARSDVVVLIDSQVFSKQVAQRVRRTGSKVPMLLYVAPTAWAWRPERAAALKPLFDEVLAVLPFEPEAMARLAGPPTSYVGHPALHRNPMRSEQPQRGPLLLLPGSRAGELRRHLGLMRAVAEGLAGHHAISAFILPTLPSMVERLRADVARWAVPVDVVTGTAKADAFANAVAAFAVSGTVTLELAMTGVPMLVTYVADKRQAKIFAEIGAPLVSLPNLIAGREVVGEVLFTAQPDAAVAQPKLRALLDSPEAIAAQLTGFREIRALMTKGAPEAPVADPAERVLARAAQRPLIGS